MLTGWLWAVFTIIAAFTQTLRNAMQRELTGGLGTVGATHVRFLFGFPFAVVFLAGVLIATGSSLPRPGLSFWPWVFDGALAQIAATALMLAAMGERSFVATIAYIKTEPIQVAVFGLIFLGDIVTWPMMAAILIATAGVVIMSTKASLVSKRESEGSRLGGIRPTLLGLASGGMFALSAIGFRGAILSLGLPNYVVAATFTLAVGIVLQAVLLSLYLGLRHPTVLFAIVRAWKPSLAARRPRRRDRLAVLVPGVCARYRRERAHAGFDRGFVRAACRPLRLRSAHHCARSFRHGAGRRRGRFAAVGVLNDALVSRIPKFASATY
jgi:drug/metabolite transporter (DMT)-like permease